MARPKAGEKTKKAWVEEMLAKGITKTTDVIEALKGQGVEVSEGTVNSLRSKMKKGKTGVKKVASSPPAAVPFDTPSAIMKRNGTLEHEDVQALAAIIKKVGAEQVRTALDIYEFLS